MTQAVRNAITGFGFLMYDPSSSEHSDSAKLFVPEGIAQNLALLPGASALMQGLRSANDSNFYVRSRAGLEYDLSGKRIPFIATLKFPNIAGSLRRFLSVAKDEAVVFTTIRTFGYRDGEWSDLVFEGTVADEDEQFVRTETVREVLGRIAAKCDVSLLRSEVLRFAREPVTARISKAIYYLDVPVIGGRFVKLTSTPGPGILGGLGPGRHVVRLVTDLDTGTLRVDVAFSSLQHYILEIACETVGRIPPITEAVLNAIDPELNVEAIEGVEAAEPPDVIGHDPRKDPTPPPLLLPRVGGSSQLLPPDAVMMGVIGLLCTAQCTLDADSQLRIVEKALAEIPIDKGKLSVRRMSFKAAATILEEHGNKARKAGREEGEDVEEGVFRRLLNEGRYAFISRLGDGGFGRVNRYLDLRESAVVAGKHINGLISKREIEALRLNDPKKKKKLSENLPTLLDYFVDDRGLVLVTECLDFSLSRQGQPVDLQGFAEMAKQLLNGLAVLHAAGLVHNDIKAENVGGAYVKGRILWKLIDFGLARKVRLNDESAPWVAGTPSYISPQALRGAIGPSNDIYSLGILFFEVLCDWAHPSVSRSGAAYRRWAIPVEVKKQIDKEENEFDSAPVVFDWSRWRPSASFCSGDGSEAALEALGRIVFRMIALDGGQRYLDVKGVATDLEVWRSDWLPGTERLV